MQTVDELGICQNVIPFVCSTSNVVLILLEWEPAKIHPATIHPYAMLPQCWWKPAILKVWLLAYVSTCGWHSTMGLPLASWMLPFLPCHVCWQITHTVARQWFRPFSMLETFFVSQVWHVIQSLRSLSAWTKDFVSWTLFCMLTDCLALYTCVRILSQFAWQGNQFPALLHSPDQATSLHLYFQNNRHETCLLGRACQSPSMHENLDVPANGIRIEGGAANVRTSLYAHRKHISLLRQIAWCQSCYFPARSSSPRWVSRWRL